MGVCQNSAWRLGGLEKNYQETVEHKKSKNPLFCRGSLLGTSSMSVTHLTVLSASTNTAAPNNQLVKV